MTIHIENLEFATIIGILDFERLTPQKVRLQCRIDYQYTHNAYVDYAYVSKAIIECMQKEQFELIETALDTLSELLKKSFPSIEKLFLRIDKPDILQNCTVGVSMEYSYDTI